MAKKVKVKLKRGLAGKREEHILAVKALGLKKVGDVRVLPDDPRVWGNIKKAHYLLEVEVIEDDKAS